MHDRLAELAGLRDELAISENGPRESRRGKSDEIRAEITRVHDELEDEAKDLEARSEALTGRGQDVPAAEAAVAARDIRQALAADGAGKAKPSRAKPAGKQNAAAAKAPEQT